MSTDVAREARVKAVAESLRDLADRIDLRELSMDDGLMQAGKLIVAFMDVELASIAARTLVRMPEFDRLFGIFVAGRRIRGGGTIPAGAFGTGGFVSSASPREQLPKPPNGSGDVDGD